MLQAKISATPIENESSHDKVLTVETFFVSSAVVLHPITVKNFLIVVKPALLLKKYDHIQGSTIAPIVLIEYGDYQCFYCRKLHPIIRDLRQQLDHQLCFVFRHFPLATIHPYTQYAAEVAEAAAAQGRFWEIHDYLFEHPQVFGNGGLLSYAANLGIDGDRFEQEVAEHRYAARVREHLVSGIESGVNGTPTLFINEERYEKTYSFDAISTAIRAVLLA